jgi:Xaa-Pro aminopeptidase
MLGCMDIEILRQRRLALQVPALLWSGGRSPRNFPANQYPFRASSHFLYFAGMGLENAVIHLDAGQLTLFWDEPSVGAALWHGPIASRETLAQCLGAAAAYPLEALTKPQWHDETATIQMGGLQGGVLTQQSVMGRELGSAIDIQLAKAIVHLRLRQDASSIAEMQRAAAVTGAAHRAGMAATGSARTEAQVRAAMEQVILAADMTTAYNSIVTIQGEVLHNEHYHHEITAGDLLLADVGAETPGGWAADVTRTWPVSGQFSPTQRDLYDVVLAAQTRSIAAIQPGIEYQDIHLRACLALTEGLVDLGILVGNPEDLVAADAHALFFPHGIGHLLGLDVHDMEDLGDLAGYADGRTRSDRFGLGYLRLNRPLRAGMVVTIEPGFYQVPALLNDPSRRAQYSHQVDWQRLELFQDVRGIRIEDDVLVTSDGSDVLTKALPTARTAIENLIIQGKD